MSITPPRRIFLNNFMLIVLSLALFVTVALLVRQALLREIFSEIFVPYARVLQQDRCTGIGHPPLFRLD